MDGHLLDQFVSRRDEAAFEAIINRHGPMVLGVCQHVLGDRHDAEDVFQATFLVLAHRASSIKKREVLGSWLYGVACRLARRAKADAARRRLREQQGARMPASQPSDDLAWREMHSALHAEINRLPARYRDPVVLCYLEGLSCEAAAQQMQCPVGTVKCRLSRARELLQTRLARHDMAIPATSCVVVLSQQTATPVPGSLRSSTVAAAMEVVRGDAEPCRVAARVPRWVETVLRRRLLSAPLTAAWPRR